MKKISQTSRKKYIPLLKKTFLFQGMDEIPKVFLTEADGAEWLSFEKGEAIYDYDSYKKSLGLILRGRVSVKKDRERKVPFNTLKAGEAFGGAVLFGQGPFIASVSAQSQSDILFISSDMMEALMEEHREINMNYIRYLTESLAFLNERLDIFSAGCAEERTARYLKMKCQRDGEGNCAVEDMSMTAMAEYLSVGRATLYRILGEMEEKGAIRKDGRKIYLLKGESL